METTTYQTVRLTVGRHANPDDGACVMELASMLAGERFSDHPRAVCPILAAVLRAYNDGTDDVRRQDLYAYAAAVVGTRDRGARRARVERCMRFFGRPASTPWLLMPSRMRALCVAVLRYARKADDDAHRRFLALIDELTARDDAVAPATMARAA